MAGPLFGEFSVVSEREDMDVTLFDRKRRKVARGMEVAKPHLKGGRRQRLHTRLLFEGRDGSEPASGISAELMKTRVNDVATCQMTFRGLLRLRGERRKRVWKTVSG